MKKILIVVSFVIILLVSFLGVTYSYEYSSNEYLSFELVGPSKLYIDVNNDYIEYGIKVINNGVDISSSVNIDSSLIDTSILGEYKVKYEIDIDGRSEYVYRDVVVIDKICPVIELNGNDIVYIELDSNYYEEGFVVNDNYDKFLAIDDVLIEGNVNTSKVGEYEIVYSLVDSSGNKGVNKRRVIVYDQEIGVLID